MVVRLGPHQLCEQCQQVNDGLVATRHRQVHVRAHGQESCVDEHLAGLMAGLWEVCETSSCCQDFHGRAYVVPSSATAGAAERYLTELGLVVESEDDTIFFHMPLVEPVPERSPHGRIPEAGDLLPVLHQARRQLVGVAARLSAIASDDDRGRVAEARYEVTRAGDKLTDVMRARASRLVAPSGWLRLPGALLAAALFGPVILLGAVLGADYTFGSISLPWMVVVLAFAVYVVAESPVLRLVRFIDGRLTRRAVARTLRAEPSGSATARTPADSRSGPDQDLAIIGTELRDAAHEIALVRNDLAEVAHQHLTRHPRQPPDTPAGLAWLMRDDDRVMFSVMSALTFVTQAYEACLTESELIRLWMTLPTSGADS